jgi:flavin reductase (DIM6/NTAB) family NADH-FMN oxidoreductase RutF
MPVPEQSVGPIPPGRDADEYDRERRRVLWSMPTGLFVLGSRFEGRRNMMTCNWAMQVATVPKLVAVSVEARSLTRALMDRGGSFSLSVLPRSELAVVRRFVKPVDGIELDGDGRATSLQGVPVFEVAGGLPCVSSALSWLACVVRHSLDWDADTDADVVDGASHVLFVGEVVDVGERAVADGQAADVSEALQMGDTRMNYGG